MITIFDKYASAKSRLDKYAQELKDMAEMQLKAAIVVYAPIWGSYGNLPRGNKYFAPCAFVDIDGYDVCDRKEFSAMWVGHGEPDQLEKSVPFHPIMLDETKTLQERYDAMVAFFADEKARGDKANEELRLALLEKQKRDLESQIVAIEQQLKDANDRTG